MFFGFKNNNKKLKKQLLAAVMTLVIAFAALASGCSGNTEDTDAGDTSPASVSQNSSHKDDETEKGNTSDNISESELEKGGNSGETESGSGKASEDNTAEGTEPAENTDGRDSGNTSSDDSQSDTKADAEVPSQSNTQGSQSSDDSQNSQNTQNTQPASKPADQPVTEGTTEKPEETLPPAAEKVCVVSISCATVLNNMDKLKEEKKDIVPPGGIILSGFQVELQEGDTAYEVLKRACQENRIHMDADFTPAYGTAYIKGIGNIYEKDCGSLSGWTYCVNGQFPSVGSSSFQVKEGDVVEFLYTCDMGADVGNSYP